MRSEHSLRNQLPPQAFPRSLKFCLLSPERIRDISKVKISELPSASAGKNTVGGLNDLRFGPDSRCQKCMTCGENNKDCLGHFGSLELARGVFDFGSLQDILNVLRCVCPHCSRLLLSRRDRSWKKLMSITNGKTRMKMLVKQCEKLSKCYYPPRVKGQQAEGCGLYLAKYKYLENVRILAEFQGGVVYPRFSDDARFFISAETVRRIFAAIKVADYDMLMFDPEYRRPEWMITTVLAIPPVCTRPSNKSNSAAPQEDEITRKLSDIHHWNALLFQSIRDLEKVQQDMQALLVGENEMMLPESQQHTDSSSTGPVVTDPVAYAKLSKEAAHLETEIVKTTNMLQMNIAFYMDERSISPQSKGKVIGKSNKQSKGWAQKFGHKEGLFRSHLMGKRNDYTSRTVISPDPNIALDQVGIPQSVAKILTFTETVTEWNVDRLEKMVKNGPDAVFGANSVIKEDGSKIDLRLSTEEVLPLQFGMKVERHLIDGDCNVFNRQPSLHRMSLMGHKAVILPCSTFRLNLSATTPYNADFDGDEMNLGPCQDLQDKAEVSTIMMVEQNILTPQSGKPCMALVQDHLLGISLLTGRDAFLDRGQAMQLLGYCKRWLCREEKDRLLPEPVLLKPRELWTGKQILSCLLPKWNYVNHASDSPSGKDSEQQATVDFNGHKFPLLDMTPTDTRVLIRDGELLSGHLCKKSIGPTQNSLIHLFMKEVGLGPTGTKDFIGDLQHVAMEYLSFRGFSFGDSDLPVDKGVKKKTREAIQLMSEKHQQWKREKLPEEEIEMRILKLANDSRSALCSDLNKTIRYDNNFKHMVAAQSKGSPVNLGNITVLTGQNVVEGKRIPYAFTNRVSPHHKQFDDGPVARGFSDYCLMNGIGPWAFWCYTMSGREGLIDTAVKTSEIGYLQRRLGKASEDIGVFYDGTVRNAQGTVILFCCGEDAMDGMYMEFHPYPPWSMTKTQYEECLYWTEEELASIASHETGGEKTLLSGPVDRLLIEMERSRLEKDWNNMTLHRENYKTFRTPVHFQRILDNLPRCSTSPSSTKEEPVVGIGKMIRDLIYLQQRLWKDLPLPMQHGFAWESKFAQLLRWSFASKRMAKSLLLLGSNAKNISNGIRNSLFGNVVMTEYNWHHCLKAVEYLFPRYLAQPGDMVGTVAAQAIGEPGTQMSVSRDTRVVIFCKQTGSVFVGPVEDFVDPFFENGDKRHPDLSTSRGKRSGDLERGQERRAVDLPRDTYYIASVTETERVKWAAIQQVSRHPPRGELMKVKTASGRRVTCTLSHSFLKRSAQHTVEPVLGSLLSVGDRIPVVRHLSTESLLQAGCELVTSIPFRNGKIPLQGFAIGWFVGCFVSGTCRVLQHHTGTSSSYSATSSTGKFLQVSFPCPASGNRNASGNRTAAACNECCLAYCRQTERAASQLCLPSTRESQSCVRIYCDWLSDFLLAYCSITSKTGTSNTLTTTGTIAEQPCVPDFAQSAPSAFVVALLQAYFDGAAENMACSSCCTKQGTAGCHTDPKSLLSVCCNASSFVGCLSVRDDCSTRLVQEQVASLLTRCRVFGWHDEREGQPRSRLCIGGRYLQLFAENVGSCLPCRTRWFSLCCSSRRASACDGECPGQDCIPEIRDSLQACCSAFDVPLPSPVVGGSIGTDSTLVDRGSLETCLALFSEANNGQDRPLIAAELKALQQACDADVLWDEIQSIEYLPDPGSLEEHRYDEYVYDFTVPDTQTFAVENGILVHNTLNVFHHLNVNEKNMPLGIGRLKELINNAKNTKNPCSTVYLKPWVRTDEQFAKKFASDIREKRLKDAILEDCVVFDPVPDVDQLAPLFRNMNIQESASSAVAGENNNNGVSAASTTSLPSVLQLLKQKCAEFVKQSQREEDGDYRDSSSDDDEEATGGDTPRSATTACSGDTDSRRTACSATVIDEDEELVNLFTVMPDRLDLSRRLSVAPLTANNTGVTSSSTAGSTTASSTCSASGGAQSASSEWSMSVIRLVLDGVVLMRWGITVEDVVSSLRQVFQDSIHLEYSSSSFSRVNQGRVVIRIRCVVERRVRPLPGEDCALSTAVLKYINTNLIVGGIPGIKKTFVQSESPGQGQPTEYFVETEGSNLAGVLSNLYVDKTRSYSNNVKEVCQLLGIEAALLSIEREINQILVSYNIYVDNRHLALLANLMCNRERIMGMTRHGMNRLETVGPLVKASFEETACVLKTAARFGEVDHFRGVSSAIIVGTVPSIGTGKVELMLDQERLLRMKPAKIPALVRKLDQKDAPELVPNTRSSSRARMHNSSFFTRGTVSSSVNAMAAGSVGPTSTPSSNIKSFTATVDDILSSVVEETSYDEIRLSRTGGFSSTELDHVSFDKSFIQGGNAPTTLGPGERELSAGQLQQLPHDPSLPKIHTISSDDVLQLENDDFTML